MLNQEKSIQDARVKVEAKKPTPTNRDLRALLSAAEKMRDFLQQTGLTEDELLADFTSLRKQNKCQG